MSDFKYSLQELKKIDRETLAGPWDVGDDASDGEVIDRDRGKVVARIGRGNIAANTAGIAVMRNTFPVLLEIASAAERLKATECTCGAELGCFADCERQIAANHLTVALAKVRP